jgi:hypothetical protein
MTGAPRPRLRWFQYRLRSLFVLTLLVAIGMSYVAVTIQEQRRHHDAAVAIEKAGAKVFSERTWLGELLRDDSLVGVRSVGFPEKSLRRAALLQLGRLTQLLYLSLTDTDITDAGMMHLEGLTQLQYLSLSNTMVGDIGLVYIRGSTHLEFLILDGTRVTDAGLVQLQGLTRLLWSDLSDTKVSDAGVERLQRALPNCRIKH